MSSNPFGTTATVCSLMMYVCGNSDESKSFALAQQSLVVLNIPDYPILLVCLLGCSQHSRLSDIACLFACLKANNHSCRLIITIQEENDETTSPRPAVHHVINSPLRLRVALFADDNNGSVGRSAAGERGRGRERQKRLRCASFF
jgi:hypothetical protein